MNLHKSCLSEVLKQELKRLRDSTNPKLKQRFDAINSGIMRACLNPKNLDNIPSGLKPYRVEKVGGQIRLFYEMIEGKDVVHFVWINDETCMHDTNNGQENDPCYNEFTRLYNKQNLEKYVPEEVVVGQYEQKDRWLSEQVYATYKEALAFSQCTMVLEATGAKSYSIIGIYSSSLKLDLERKLISKMLESSKDFGISFTHDLYLGGADEITVRNALIENGFKCSYKDTEIETWEYK